MKQKLKLLFILICTLSVLQTKAQKGPSCDSAKVLTYPIDASVVSYTNDAYWFKVTLDTGSFSIDVTTLPGVGKILKEEVYTGTCNSLSFLRKDSLWGPTDTTLNVYIHNAVSPTSFYIKLYNAGGSVSFKVKTTYEINIMGNIGFCPGEQVTLMSKVFNTAGSPPPSAPSYTWLPGGANTSSITITSPSTITPTTYTLIYTDASSVTLTHTINIFPLGPNECKNCEHVQNGHLEWFENLSPSAPNITDCKFWTTAGPGASNYFTAVFGNAPANGATTNTPPHSGNAYAGLETHGGGAYNTRQYIASSLKCALTPGQAYLVSFYAILANKMPYASNHIGAKLSVSPLTYTATTPYAGPLGYTPPDIDLTSILNYTTSWTQISGLVTGNNQQYITIGNFYGPANTTTAVSTSPYISAMWTSAYYYIDDVSITPLTPTLSASTNTVGCQTASTITLTATGCSSVYTTWSNGVTTYTGSIVSIPTPTTTTTYTCNVTLPCASCSTLTQTITVIAINNSPTVTASASPSSICLGQSSTLTASGASTYTWNPGALTGSVITVTPTVTTTYTVTGTNTIGCTKAKTITITVNSLPTITISASPTIVCFTSSTLTASGATTYTWNTGAITASLNVTPTVTTTYTVTGTNSNGCVSSNTVTVTYGQTSPTISVSSSTTIACTGSTTLTASGGTSYTWTPGAVTTPSIAVTASVVTVYTITSTLGTGCGTYTFAAVVNPVASTLCCSSSNTTIGTSLTSSVNMASGTYATSGTIIDMQGTITFTANTSFNGYTLRMKPNTLLKVAGNYTLSLTNCKLFSCSELWNGIELVTVATDVHGQIILNNTTVEDMYNGIVLNGSNLGMSVFNSPTIISSTASILNKNYISFQYKNIDGMTTITNSYTNNPYPFSLITTTISSNTSSTSPGSTLKPSSTYTYAYNTWPGGASSSTNTPFVNFPRAYAGIVLDNLHNTSAIIIGDSVTSVSTNTFDNLDFGIKGTEVTAKVHNNYFKNITGSTKQNALGADVNPPATGPDEIGIAIAMTHTSTNTHTLTVGTKTTVPSAGNPYPKGNVFEDCNKGVKAVSCKNVYVKANQFNSTTTSTLVTPPADAYYYYKNQNAIWVSALSDEESLSYNYIRNFATGIYSSHTFTTSARPPYIIKNDIAAPSSTGYCQQAIQIAQVGGTSINSYVDDNKIDYVYNGILSGGVSGGISIYNNSVLIENTTKALATTSTTARVAIKMSNSPYGRIAGNSVYTNASSIPSTSVTANYLTGIYVAGSANAKVECNTVYHIGRDFVFEGACSGSSWKVNTMYDSYRGLEMRLSAVIGQQGIYTYTGTPNLSANTWTTVTEETYVVGTTNVNTASQLCLITTSGNPKTEPTLNYPTASSSRYQPGINMGLKVTTGTSYTCNTGNAQRLANTSNGGGKNTGNNGGSNKKTSGANTDSLTEYTNLAIADENAYEVFAEEMMFQNRQNIYSLIKQDSINPAYGSILESFYNNNQNTAIDKLTEAQIAIAEFDVSAAVSANSSAPVSSTVEQKHQRANDLTLKYMADRNYQFTSGEKAELRNMANDCPVKGAYVIQSRNLVDIFTFTSIQYDDNCEVQASASRKTKTPDALSNRTLFNLFPNPNNGLMQLDYNLGGYGTAKFNLFDITGKLIQTKNIETNEGSLYINEQNLKNGVYFYTILVGEKNIKTDKIVIIK